MTICIRPDHGGSSGTKEERAGKTPCRNVHKPYKIVHPKNACARVKGIKAKQRLAKHRNKVSNQRNDWLHKLSARIVSEHDTISIEDLNLKGLVRTKLAKSFNDAAISAFLRQLEYKAQWNGVQLVKVGRFFASSKTCFDCGSKQPLTLSERLWQCAACGAKYDRDGNAAMNIIAEGLRIIAACRDALK